MAILNLKSEISNFKLPMQLDLGTVHHLARVRLNGRDLGVVWCAPWRAAIPAGLLKDKDKQLEIEVTNVWANRLIGDEEEPADCEWRPCDKGGAYLKQFPDWFVKKNRAPRRAGCVSCSGITSPQPRRWWRPACSVLCA
jgi:hypothetical protein